MLKSNLLMANEFHRYPIWTYNIIFVSNAFFKRIITLFGSSWKYFWGVSFWAFWSFWRLYSYFNSFRIHIRVYFWWFWRWYSGWIFILFINKDLFVSFKSFRITRTTDNLFPSLRTVCGLLKIKTFRIVATKGWCHIFIRRWLSIGRRL